MIRPLAVAVLLAGFASSLFADGSTQTRITTPTTDWARPTEAGVAWDSGDYAYDGSGNIARIGLDAFGYDGTNRLTSGTVNAYGVATTQTFQYDRFGNILRVSTTPDYGGAFPVPPETAELEVHSGTNRLSRGCKPVHGCETWTYDGTTGNVTSSQKSGGSAVFSVAYGWDPDGAMTELEGGNAHERYIYDANDERIITVSLDGANEVIRRWTWRDAEDKVAREAVEQVGVGVWSEARDNVYRTGTLLAAYTAANATVADRHYHVDHLGTPRLITDAARHKVAIEAYLPFGDRAPGSELPYVGFKDRMRFTGHERDGEGSPYRPSLDYMHARYYTPEWGRFLSVDRGRPDPKKPQSWNRYAYTMNNPINNTDPDGLETNPVTGQSYILDSQILVSKNNPRKGFFGMVRRNADGSPKKHGGNDIKAPRGTPVFAPVTGTVVQSGWAGGDGGNVLRIRRATDENGQAVYVHISHLNAAPNVKVGDKVVEGQPNIAEIGNTGNAKNEDPHAHTAVMVGGQSKDHQVDPQQWFRDHPSTAQPQPQPKKEKDPCEPNKQC